MSKVKIRELNIALPLTDPFTMLPWVAANLGRIFRGASPMLLVCVALLLADSTKARQTVEIRGDYTTSKMRCTFVANLSGDRWSIYVEKPPAADGTNLYSVLDGRWEQLVFDGTNTYYTSTFGDHFASPALTTNELFTSISSSAICDPGVASYLDIYVPWLVFALSPQTIAKAPLKSIPLPWFDAHHVPAAFGYKWEAKPSADGRFVKECEIIRDSSLDLSDEQEFLRPEFEYPCTLVNKMADLENLKSRRQIPGGFVVARYGCTNWLETNSMLIPQTALFTRFLYRRSTNQFQVYRAVLQAKSVVVSDSAPEPPHPPSGLTVQVYDFRYRAVNASRVFTFASYVLNTNAEYKSGSDPLLLAQRDEWLSNGRKYNDFPETKNYLAWLMLAVLFLPPIIFMLIKNAVKNKQKTNENTE